MNKSSINTLIPHRVESLTKISSEGYLLSFFRIFSFTPGQLVALSTQAEDNSPRVYSICSGSDETEISILFNIVPGGKLTNQLIHLKKGDTIYCSEPYGTFLGDNNPAYWIASGTGIAPFISMYRSGLSENKILIHGGRAIESFYFQEELLKEFQDRYIRCSSTEKGSGVFEGRLTRYLEQTDGFNSGHRFYLCGSAEMVVEARDILISKGVEYNMILSEIYF